MNPTRTGLQNGRTSLSKRHLGLTLVEMLCSLAITASTIGVSTSSMRDMMLSQRLQAAAAELESEVQLARSTAVSRSQVVRLAIQPLDQGSCTIIHTGPKNACQCTSDGPPICQAESMVLHFNPHDSRTGVKHLSTTVSLAFSPLAGTVTPTATLKLSDSKGRALHQVVNLMGRTRTCSPLSAIAGYKPC